MIQLNWSIEESAFIFECEIDKKTTINQAWSPEEVKTILKDLESQKYPSCIIQLPYPIAFSNGILTKINFNFGRKEIIEIIKNEYFPKKETQKKF